MSKYRKNTGNIGEDVAEKYLVTIGMEIVTRNYYINHGEIDIIAVDGECTVFVEVKTRRSDSFGSGLEAITPAKKRALLRTAEQYAASNGLLNTPMRFDVIEVTFDQAGEACVNYIKNAEMGY